MAERVLKRKIDEKLRDWLSSEYKDCLIVKGARQIGKSYAVEHFLQNEAGSYVTLNFMLNKRCRWIFEDDVSIEAIVTKISALLGFRPVPNETVIFLDEIQLCPAARPLLKAFVLDGRYRVIASGSLLGMSQYGEEDSNDPVEAVESFPVGYERVENMYSLDFEEFLWACGTDQGVVDYVKERISRKEGIDGLLLDSFESLFRLFTVVGGMPEAVAAYLKSNDIADARAVQSKIMAGYRDDIGRYAPQGIRDKVFAVFDSLPMQLAEENTRFRYNRIDAEFVPNYDTYGKAINWLCDAMIATRCYNLTSPAQPLEAAARLNIFKIYLADTGLFMSTLDASVVKGVIVGDARINKGGLGENIIAECISKSGRKLFYFDNNSMEVDFITVLGREVAAVEVKTGNNNRAKSLRSIKENYGVKRRIKFERSNIRVDDDGVEHYPLFAAAFIGLMAGKVDLRYAPPDPRLLTS